MSIDAFIDSNIFVYLFDSTSPDKRYRAKRLAAKHSIAKICNTDNVLNN